MHKIFNTSHPDSAIKDKYNSTRFFKLGTTQQIKLNSKVLGNQQ